MGYSITRLSCAWHSVKQERLTSDMGQLLPKRRITLYICCWEIADVNQRKTDIGACMLAKNTTVPRADPRPKRVGLLLPFTIGHFANDWAPTGIWLIVPAVAVAMDLPKYPSVCSKAVARLLPGRPFVSRRYQREPAVSLFEVQANERMQISRPLLGPPKGMVGKMPRTVEYRRVGRCAMLAKHAKKQRQE